MINTSEQKIKNTPRNSKNGSHDYFLLALTWMPRFYCRTSRKYLEQTETETGLTVHGLWPSSFDRRSPVYCSRDNMTDTSTNTIVNSINNSNLSNRERYQWLKHGSCGDLEPFIYFREEKKLNSSPVVTNIRTTLMKNTDKGIINVSDVINNTGVPVLIKTDSSCSLEEVSICFERAQDGRPGKAIKCPDQVSARGRNSHVKYQCSKLYIGSSCSDLSKSFQALLKRSIIEESSQ